MNSSAQDNKDTILGVIYFHSNARMGPQPAWKLKQGSRAAAVMFSGTWKPQFRGIDYFKTTPMRTKEKIFSHISGDSRWLPLPLDDGFAS
jgi:hypothetical protein